MEGDKREIRSTIDAVNKHSHQLNELVQRGLDANGQSAMLAITALLCLTLGSTLFLPIASFIARLMPESMNMPESMASYILDPPMQKAGIHLIDKDDRKVWNVLYRGYNMMISNSREIEKCEKEALNSNNGVNCVVTVKSKVYNTK